MKELKKILHRVNENAMTIELRKMGCKVSQQKNIRVYYENEEVGDYYADLLVDELVIVELKAAESLCEKHEAQLINYLSQSNPFGKSNPNRSWFIAEFWQKGRVYPKDPVWEKKNIY